MVDEEVGVYELKVNGTKYVGKTLIELDLRNKYNVNIVTIKRDDQSFIPKGVDTLKHGDIILVIGKHDKIGRFEETLSE
jgi:trk system potassium uptake protein TrkA